MFFDLRDVPTHEPQPYRTERRQDAEPESFGPSSENKSSGKQEDQS